MLEHGKRKATEKGVNIEWIKADCRDFNLNRKFNLIFFPFSSIAHLHDLESLDALFSCVKEHLTEEGRFIVDHFNPRLDFLTRDPNKRHPVTEYPDPDGKGTVVITETNVYDNVYQISRVKWHYKIGDGEEVVKELDIRIFFPQEFNALLIYSGFKIEAKYGDYDESPFSSSSPKQLLVCHVR
jgi:SAM-dependent methyltransferase